MNDLLRETDSKQWSQINIRHLHLEKEANLWLGRKQARAGMTFAHLGFAGRTHYYPYLFWVNLIQSTEKWCIEKFPNKIFNIVFHRFLELEWEIKIPFPTVGIGNGIKNSVPNQTWKRIAKRISKIPHTEDTNSLDRCG